MKSHHWLIPVIGIGNNVLSDTNLCRFSRPCLSNQHHHLILVHDVNKLFLVLPHRQLGAFPEQLPVSRCVWQSYRQTTGQWSFI